MRLSGDPICGANSGENITTTRPEFDRSVQGSYLFSCSGNALTPDWFEAHQNHKYLLSITQEILAKQSQNQNAPALRIC